MIRYQAVFGNCRAGEDGKLGAPIGLVGQNLVVFVSVMERIPQREIASK
jgi:hypothetical protein